MEVLYKSQVSHVWPQRGDDSLKSGEKRLKSETLSWKGATFHLQEVPHHLKGVTSHQMVQHPIIQVKCPNIKRCYHPWKGATSSLQVQCPQGRVQHPLEKVECSMDSSSTCNVPSSRSSSSYPMCARVSRQWSHVIKRPNVFLGVKNDYPL